MNSAPQAATLVHSSWTGNHPILPRDHNFDVPPFLCLPILTRSAALLTLLLQESSVDLELTSAIVAMDPGLAFTILQIANREGHEQDEAIWQFPLALVACGHGHLLQVISQVPKIEGYSSTKTRAQLGQLWMRAVVRASVAFVLGKQLEGGNPRQAFLAGLLFELPALVRLGFLSSAERQDELQLAIRASLPPQITAAIGQAPDRVRVNRSADCHFHFGSHSGPSSEERAQTWSRAILLLAEALLRSTIRESVPSPERCVALASNAAWQCWKETSMEQRRRLLEGCWRLARWAAVNAPKMNPWEFTARLERSKGWE
ncbi:MAG: HDOD domain-containing protein [Candidatus Korobacteraceae bacterium]